MSDNDHKSRGQRAASLARSVGHRNSGGHSPLIARHNRFERDANSTPGHPRKAHAMPYKPYPKWLHFDGEPSVLVQDEAEHEAHLASRGPAPDVTEEAAPKAKGDRSKKTEPAEPEAPEVQADPDAE